MRVLWLCNICPPAVAVALGKEYSVREGWITGALNRYLLEAEGDSGAENGGLKIGICFPTDVQEGYLQRKVRLETFGSPDAGAVNGKGTPAGQHRASREVQIYGFAENLKRPEIYDKLMENRFAQILADFQPDLVHIFGTEFPHALAMARSFGRPERILVGLQGLMGECTRSYMADLPQKVQRRATFRDRLRKDSLRQQQAKFEIRAGRERELLKLCGHVVGRTDFDRQGSLALNPALRYHKMNETMRACFYEGKWEREKCRDYEIFISQGDYPLKGFHYLLQAMPKILESFPRAHISVAGISISSYDTWKEKLKISGYGKYLHELICQYSLEEKVSVLGQLSDVEMKEAYLNSHVFVCPSALENSPNSLGEAMLLGVPCAAARTGGIPSMAEDGKSALFFEKGNVSELADRIMRIFREDDLAHALSENAAARARENHDGEANYRTMLKIYQEVVGQS